jgi:hypothetical protein
MNDDFLVSLGLELYQEFQQWNYSLIDDWLNSIELLEKDLQPLARLHLNLEDLSEITDLFRDLDAWLTADFVPSLRSKDGEMSSLERDSYPFELGGNTSSFMSFSRQSLASTSDYTQTNLRVRTSNYLPLQKEQKNSYNLRQKKQISFDDNHQANNIYPQNNAPKRWQELTDLVRDISGENLPLDSDNLNSETTPWQNQNLQPKTESESNNPSPKRWRELTNLVRDISGENLLVYSAIEADISSQLAEILPMPNPPQLLQQSRARVYHQSNNINSNYSSLQETELEINKQESENQNQSFDQQFSFQEIEEQSVDLDYIMESLERKINQEYRRFYGG